MKTVKYIEKKVFQHIIDDLECSFSDSNDSGDIKLTFYKKIIWKGHFQKFSFWESNFENVIFQESIFWKSSLENGFC